MEKIMTKKLALILLTLMLASTLLAAGVQTTNAHDPPLEIATYAYLAVTPNPIGVNQEVLIYMWLQRPPPTALGAYGDRFEGYELTITKPDGTTETKGPFTSDPVAFAWMMYTPTQAGTYQFQFSFPGQTLEGKNLHPTDQTGRDFINDVFLPSTSDKKTLVVQQDPIMPYPEVEPPAGYWSRPISGEFRDWSSFSGNWLSLPLNRWAQYTTAPETAHILWTREMTFGGLVGGQFGPYSYHCGNAYEGKWNPPVIINGILYYNEHPASYNKRGAFAVDMRTGEQVWYNPNMRINFGQIYMYDSPNQHGAFAYLVETAGTTLVYYDAFSGQWWYNVTNAPSISWGTSRITPPSNLRFSSDGSVLYYTLDTRGHRLTLWNSSSMPGLLLGEAGSNAWQWRPYNKVIDGRTGYMWNVSVPADIVGSINGVIFDENGNPDSLIGSYMNVSGAGFVVFPIGDLTVWRLSLKDGQEGELIYKMNIAPPSGATLALNSWSEDDDVFVLWCAETRQYWGYRISDGSYLWGPTEAQTEWDYTVGTTSQIAYGKLFSAGYGGVLYCYNVQTGQRLWEWAAEDPYYLEAKWAGNYMLDIAFIADEKIYVHSGEHSPDNPKERGAPLACIDINTGEALWKIPFYMPNWARNPAIGDGIFVYDNAYDNRIYAFGKGQTITTVSASPEISTKGSSVMIKGFVTDQSPDAKDTPAISDQDMSEWMKYLYMQYPMPTNAKGVDVTLTAVGPDGSTKGIGTVTSDINGMFYLKWTPEQEGAYKIIATFEGSESYWSSSATTAIGVDSALTSTDTNTGTASVTGVDSTVIIGIAAVALIVAIIAIALALRKR